MNYIFVKTIDAEYPVLYRHDKYGVSNPTLRVCYLWLKCDEGLKKSEFNLSLAVL